MTHAIYRVVSFEIVDPYTLRVEFDDATVQVIDFRPVLEGAVYGPLQDERLFTQVEIDPEVHTLVRPNGADFDPETLHDWPKYAREMIRMAKHWAKMKEQVTWPGNIAPTPL
jgi:hypothetical protein